MVAAANSRLIPILPSAPSPDPGMPLMPISPPSQPCLREACEQEIHADRGHGEKVAAHPQRREADHDTEQAADHDRRYEREQNVAGANHGERSRIGAGPIEGAMAAT